MKTVISLSRTLRDIVASVAVVMRFMQQLRQRACSRHYRFGASAVEQSIAIDPSTTRKSRIVAHVCWATLLTVALSASVQAQPNCSSAFLIDETTPTGSRWQMCWEHRFFEGIVYNDVYFTPPGGEPRKVLNQGAIAQIHVPYDDNGARFHDVSDYGLGENNLNNMSASDCPGGALLRANNKNMVCKNVERRGHAHADGDEHLHGYALNLFSVSHVGRYNYIPQWRFFDDGTIELVMGATGTLQRTGGSIEYGWRLGNGSVGISHLHNYFWRLDFDLGEVATDDVFEEFNFDAGGGARARGVTRFFAETARSTNPTTMRRWRVRDDTLTNEDGHPISYEILPLETGHRDTGPSNEPFTFNDIYVTRYKACERFASHNPSGGVGCGDDVSDFVNGESLSGADLVVWFGMSFHHIPRAEDAPRMHQHWNRFQLVPRDWTADNPLAPDLPVNQPPTIENPGAQANEQGESVSLAIAASDADGDSLEFSATGLPPALQIDPQSGLISGSVTGIGNYTVRVSVSDGDDDTSTTFSWTVSAPSNTPPALQNPGAQSNLEGDSVALAITATDADDDTLTFAASGLPQALQINAQSGVISGTIAAASSGTYSVRVTVSDGEDEASTAFSWAVNAPPNAAPVLVSPGAQNNVEGDSVSLPITATDANDDVLTFSATGLPPGLSINASSGLISGTLASGSANDYDVTVTVSDGQDQDTAAFTWLVTSPPLGCGPLNQEAESGELFGAFVVASRSDASGGQFVHAPNGSGYSAGPGASRAEYCFNVTESGRYRLKANVSADGGRDNSFYAQVDGLPAGGYLWDTRISASFAPDYVGDRGGDDPVEIQLSAGQHRVTMSMREDGARLDTIALERVDGSVGECGALSQEAEAGELSGAFGVTSDAGASGGQYVSVANGTGSTGAIIPTEYARYCMTVVTPGVYRIRAAIQAPSYRDNSFFVRVGGVPVQGFLWDTPRVTSGFVSSFVSDRDGANPVEVTLAAGDTVVEFFLREDGTRLDAIELVPVQP